MKREQFAAGQHYGIDIRLFEGRVRVLRGDVILAESTRAKIMYETRLKPQIYVPLDDILVPLSAQTELKTFCPFKGTARYRDVVLPDTDVPNGVWSYDDALPESRGINGYIGFLPGTYTKVELGGGSLEEMADGNISGPLVDWLMRGAAFLPTPEEFTKALAEKMLESGVAISRMSAMIWSLHPMIVGKNYIWQKGEDEIRTFAPSYELHDHPSYQNSPLHHVSAGLGGVRQKLSVPEKDMQFPIMKDLKEEGATDYVAMPLQFSNGQINVLTLASDHPNGFTTANLGLIFEISSVISRFFEVFTQRENARALLETYVGRRTGARVLGGEIRRGDGDEIDAAIMFCDLRNSTGLEEKLGRDAYLNLLNQFFETTSDAVEENGGEVLKFIGDAVLAVFPVEGNAALACSNATKAARQAVQSLANLPDTCPLPAIDCSIGLSYGRVTFGNVGSRERLDFTVIGAPANIAARLGDHGKTIGRSIVVSAEVAAHDSGFQPLGALSLHNVSEPIESFAL